jgi:hypothetical protein
MEKILIGDNNISIFLITIIAGLFGFIIASIPLTMQLLEIKNHDKIDLINSNPIMKKKIFDRYIKLIQASFYLFLFILFIELSEIIFLPNGLMIILLFCGYTYFIYNFIRQLYKLINILKELILIYTQ